MPSSALPRHRPHANLRGAAFTALLVAILAAPVGAQDVLWVSRLGADTAVVEASSRSGSRITGTIVNVAAGMLVQHYQADLDERGHIRRLRSWIVSDLDGGATEAGRPSVTVEIGGDSIRIAGGDPNGKPTVVPSVDGVVPVFDAFFNNPMALMELALRDAAARGDGQLRVYYIGSKAPEVLTLEETGGGVVAFPYVMAMQYPMLAGARLRARMDDQGLAGFDARETTFKFVTQRRPPVDAMAMARAFRDRGVGVGGFSTMSPARRASGRIGPVDVAVTYGQPSRRGRRVFPDVVPLGRVWRAGANAATRITFSADVEVAGHPVPAGSYSLWVIPGERADTLILNKADRVWGVSHDPSEDLLRVPLDRTVLDEPAEFLVWEIREAGGEGRLELAWDDRRFSVRIAPLVPKP